MRALFFCRRATDICENKKYRKDEKILSKTERIDFFWGYISRKTKFFKLFHFFASPFRAEFVLLL